VRRDPTPDGCLAESAQLRRAPADEISNTPWEGRMSMAPVPTGVERTFSQRDVLVTKTDLDDTILYANKAFLRVMGYTEDEVVGQTHEMFHYPDRSRGVSGMLTEIERAGREVFCYVAYLTKSGDYVWVISHSTPIRDASGRIIGHHTADRAPDRQTAPIVCELYARLREEERRHGGGQAGAAAGLRLFKETLAAQGMTYDEYVWAIASEDVE
jgi:PAS domain S-box-containing protein